MLVYQRVYDFRINKLIEYMHPPNSLTAGVSQVMEVDGSDSIFPDFNEGVIILFKMVFFGRES